MGSKAYQYVAREVNLVVMDIREVSRGKATKVSSGLDQFLEFVVKELDPVVTQPNVWLLISQDKEDVKDCTSFVAQHLKEYKHTLSSYVPSSIMYQVVENLYMCLWSFSLRKTATLRMPRRQ